MTLKINLMNKERLMALIFKCDHPVTRSPFSFYPSPYKKKPYPAAAAKSSIKVISHRTKLKTI